MTPLFDLLSRSSNSRAGEMRKQPPAAVPRQAKPVVRVELKPQDAGHAAGHTAGHAAGPSASAPRAEAVSHESHTLHQPVYSAPQPDRAASASAFRGPRIPLNVVGFAFAAVLVAGVLAWAGGVHWGRSQEAKRAEQELAAFRGRPSPAELSTEQRIQPPSGADAARNTNKTPIPAETGANRGVKAPVSEPAAITPRGLTTSDPREVGKNYLALATTSGAEAEAAVTFMAANGVDAFAIPVEIKGGNAKNQGPGGKYRLYVLPGLTSEQLRKSDWPKATLEAKVSQLGARWQKEYNGGSNFSSTAWYKFDPGN